MVGVSISIGRGAAGATTGVVVAGVNATVAPLHVVTIVAAGLLPAQDAQPKRLAPTLIAVAGWAFTRDRGARSIVVPLLTSAGRIPLAAGGTVRV